MARVLDLVLTKVDDEVLVYDEVTHQMHRLNAAARAVWERCDGTSTIARVAAEVHVPENDVRATLTRLAAIGLVESSTFTASSGTERRRYQRRRLLAKAASIPVIISMTAPTAAQAASGTNATCNQSCENQSGCSGCCNVCNVPGTNSSTDRFEVPYYYCYNPDKTENEYPMAC